MISASHPKVLYVDDDQENLLVLKANTNGSYEFFLFTSPLEALKQLDSISPDLIISDQNMPGMKGIEFLKLAKQLFPDVPRIIVSGYFPEHDQRRADLEIGPYFFLAKPYSTAELDVLLAKAKKR